VKPLRYTHRGASVTVQLGVNLTSGFASSQWYQSESGHKSSKI
jgi:hypothetical protein